MDEMIKPAYSAEAEQAVLYAMMITGDTELSDKLSKMLRSQDFYFPEHRCIWDACQSLTMKGQNLDPVLVAEEANEELLDLTVEICRSYASTANVFTYARIVKDRAKERRALSSLQQGISILTDSTSPFYERLKEVETLIMSGLSSDDMQSKGLVHVKEIARQWTMELAERIEGGNQPAGYSTGIDDLDALIAPKRIVPGSLVVVGARPKMGKSALLSAFAEHFSKKEATLVFSQEMPSDQVWERLLTGGVGMSPNKFYSELSGEDYYLVKEYTDHAMKRSLYIDDTPGITIGHIKSESRKISRQHKVGLICVDYLTLMKAPKADRNDLAYGSITKDLKNLARELNCVVVLLTQLNRKLEDRPIMDRKPQPSDSRDTGQIEQDCDMWIGLYRAGAYDEQCPYPDLTHVLVRLNRHGNKGHIYLNMKDGYFEQISSQIGRVRDEANVNYFQPQKRGRTTADF